MTPVTIQNLEIHVAHSCNLKCESCSHYSNHGHKGLLSLEDAEEWFALWHKRINPKVFSLLGGEPALNQKLCQFILLSRKYWPTAQLRIVTNGFFLHRHPDLPRVLKKAGNAALYLSIHHNSPEYMSKLQSNLKLLDEWTREHRIKVALYRSFENWTRRYQGFGHKIEPFEDKQPRRSWEVCYAKTCPQLFEGCLWKCPPLAYLRMQDEKYKLSDKWKPYLEYAPLSPDCPDDELQEFFSREEERFCGMCSARPRNFKLPLPFAGATKG